jgi:hypothetical protein
VVDRATATRPGNTSSEEGVAAAALRWPWCPGRSDLIEVSRPR